MKKTLLSFAILLFFFFNFFGAYAQTTLDFQNTGHNSYDYIGSPNLDLSISPKTIRFNFNNASSNAGGGPNYYISDDGTGGSSSSNLGLNIVNEISNDALTISYTDNSAFSLNAFKVIDYNAFFEALYPGSGGPAHLLTIKAYNGSTLTATLTYTYNYSGADAYNRQTINTLSANAAFGNVTKVVITATGGLDHMFDDVVIGTASASSTASTVTTTVPSSITSTSALLGGTVTSDGGASVTDRGIVYATSANPTITNTKVQIGSGTGSFSQTITGLSTSTTYHVRAYAINSLGTSYGADQSFSTSAAPVPLSTAGTQNNVSCNGGSNGSATVNVTGGTAPYTYSWSPSGGTAATASGLSAGNYTVTVTDAASATTTQSFTITQPSALSKTSSQTNVSCFGGSNGSATVNVTGGTAPYTYSWSPSGGTAATATGLSAGTYTVTITDANNCTTTQNFTLTQPSPLSSSGSQINIACNGTSTGSAAVSVSGGTAPYSYSWQNNGTTLPQTTASVSGLSAGSYTVTITDANGCTTSRSFNLTQPAPFNTTGSQTNVSTYGGSDGSATVSASGGTPGYTYSWSPSGGTAATASGLTAGNYRVTITDDNGCTVARNYTITQPAAVTAAPVILAPANGSLSNNRTPVYSGAAVAGSTVTVYVDGTLVGTATASGGSFNFIQPAALSDGSHTVYATAQSSGQTASANSNTNTFTIDATVPAAPVVVSPANGSITSNNKPSVSGAAEANSSIGIFVDGTLQGTTTTSNSGNYAFQLTAALAEGSHAVRTTATDGAGNTSPNSNTNTFTIDQTAPSVAISSTASGSTANSPIPVTVTFSEAVTGFTVGDVAVTGGTLSGFSGSGSNYSVTVTATAPGTITVGIAANSAQDAAGNGNTAAAPFSIVYAPVSSNADLLYLMFSSGALSPGFTPGRTSYTAIALNATTSLRVTPTASDGSATITVNGTTVSSGNAIGPIPLAVGSNTITTAVTAQDGLTTKTYSVVVTREASMVATLSNLSISSGTLSPTFASGTTSYSTNVSNSVSSISVTPTASDANATITVNGTMVNSGTASGTIPLAIGANTIQTIVTAQDGATTQTYTLTVTRASAAIITTSVASLPAFGSCYSNASSPQSFTVSGSGLTSDITVLPPAGFQVAQTSGGPYYGAGITLTQTGGAVSATVYARMAAATSSPSPGNVTLSATGVSTRNVAVSGTQNARPNIDPGTVASVTSASTSFSLPYTATTGSPDKYSIVTGSSLMNGFVAVTNANLPASPISVAIPAGTVAGQYNFYLTATNSGTGCISYSNYFAVNVVSTDATLSNLSISSGTLSPGFASGTNSYSASVSYATTNLTITPTASDAGATIVVNGTPVSSGSLSSTIALAAGSNTITTVVTAQDGTTQKTYSLTVTRAATSTDTNLSNLVISSGTLSPTFASGTTSYSASVNNSTTSIMVTPVVSNANASVMVNGTAVGSGSASSAIPLAVGANIIQTMITAQDGATTKTYTLNINRAQAAQLITFVALPVKTYGDADFPLNATASSGLPVTYSSSNPAVATVDSSGSIHMLAAGTTTITINQQGNANYSPATAVTQSLTVNKSSLTVSADNKTKAYGNANPALTLTYSGFVKGETAAALIARPTASTTVTTTTDAGSYPITVTGAVSSNYDFTYVNGTLTIGKASNVIAFDVLTTKTYGDADFVLSASASSGLPVTYASSDPAVTTVDASGKVHMLSAGVTTISANQQGNTNYDAATVVSQMLTVGKAALVITADAQTKTYGEANPVLTVSYSGFVNGEASSVLLAQPLVTTSVNTASAVGTYPLTVSGATAANYNISFAPADFNVVKAALTITAEDKTKIQGAANPALTVSYTGFVGGDTESTLNSPPAISTAATATSAAGAYPITVSGAQAANYSISYVPGTLTVTSAAVSAMTFTPVTLFENQSAGTPAGTLSAASANSNAVFTYAFSSGSGAADNASFSLSGNKLLTMASFDYETKSSYSVRIRATDQYGQWAEQIFTIRITDVNEAPTLARVLDDEVCLGRESRSIALSGITPGQETSQSITLDVQSSNPGLFNGLGVSSVSAGKATLNYSLAGTGTAVVTITARDNGGTANGGTDSFSQTFTITSHALPSAVISSDKGTQISKGDIVTLTVTGGDSYSWDAAPNAGGTSSSAVIKVRPEKTTTYQVKVSNASGCSSIANITIEVADDYALIQPANILTPNGDGKNDTWVVKNIDLYPNHTISIYDRGGRRLIEVKHYDNSWDGSVNGLPLTEGTYYYVIDFGEGKALKKGFITILRNR